MNQVFNYCIVYYFAPCSGGYSTISGNCVFKTESGAREEMEQKIESLKKEKRYGDFHLNTARVYSIDVK